MPTQQLNNSPRSVEDIINGISPFEPNQEVQDLINAGLIDKVMYADPLREAGMYDSNYYPKAPYRQPTRSNQTTVGSVPPNPKPRPANLQVRRPTTSVSLIPNVDLSNVRHLANRGVSDLKQHFAKFGAELAPRLAAMGSVESGFNPTALSKAGARGLMQLMPETGRWMAKRLGLDHSNLNLNDPAVSIMLGGEYYKHLLNTFDNDEADATAAYNAGPSVVRRAMRRAGSTNYNTYKTYLPEETRGYVEKVRRAEREMRRDHEW